MDTDKLFGIVAWPDKEGLHLRAMMVDGSYWDTVINWDALDVILKAFENAA